MLGTLKMMHFTLPSSTIKYQTSELEKSTTLVMFYNMIFQPHCLRQFQTDKSLQHKTVIRNKMTSNFN